MNPFKNSPEAEARYRAQRRNTTIASLLIGVLVLLLIGVIFLKIGVYIYQNKTEPIVTFTSPVISENVLEKPKVTNQVVKKPSPSSSSAVSQVLVSKNSTSSFSVPVADTVTDNLSLDFGTSEGFGSGWGDTGSGFGSAGGGEFALMGQKGSGERVCFIIDYSKSMDVKDKIGLLKKELKETLEDLPSGIDFSLIFFAGPIWTHHDRITHAPSGGGNNTKMEYDGKEYIWKHKNWKLSSDESKVLERNPEWLTIDSGVKEELVAAVEEMNLSYGTEWGKPLEKAFELKPLPEVIVFLTDGLTGKDPNGTVEQYGELAKKKGVKINTISLLEPKARPAMSRLADLAGGEFSLVDKSGKKVSQTESKDKK